MTRTVEQREGEPTRLLDLTASQRSLSLFRVVLYSVFAAEMVGLVAAGEAAINGRWPLALPLVALVGSVAAIVGFRIRAAAVTVFIALKLLQGHLWAWYEVDWVMELFSLLFCFAPRSTVWSLDSRGAPRDEQVPAPFVLAVATVLGVIYLDATVTKLRSEIWVNGSAVWMASFLPHVSERRLPSWLEVQPVLAVLTWVTLAYEALFPAILLRATRKVMVVLGIGLHLAIAALTPLPYFGLIMCAPLLLFMPVAHGARPPFSAQPRLGLATVTYCLLVVIAFAHMKTHDDQRGLLTSALGVHPTGVYADAMFTVARPITRLVLVTPTHSEELPSFDADGYPTTSNRWWKIQAFFTRTRSDGEAMLLRYITQFADRCDRAPCEVILYTKGVQLDRLGFDASAADELRSRPWVESDRIQLHLPALR
ncbi:MAG: HTTM domain-containing protein [Actinomycetota bacterium]|nr:HTTM domain-containing protein [Actinomycetota bacterium]